MTREVGPSIGLTSDRIAESVLAQPQHRDIVAGRIAVGLVNETWLSALEASLREETGAFVEIDYRTTTDTDQPEVLYRFDFTPEAQ